MRGPEIHVGNMDSIVSCSLGGASPSLVTKCPIGSVVIVKGKAQSREHWKIESRIFPAKLSQG